MEYLSKHVIVGAGISGLGVAAAFKRADIPFDVFEGEQGVGGNWRHGVYENVHIISSRKTTELTDWPMPTHWPDFPSQAQMLEYLEGYARHHDLYPHITFGRRVRSLAPTPEGTWVLTFEDGEVRTYGGAVVANGHHWDKRMPTYPGTFDGVMIHSKDYKSPRSLEGKRVLVIGGGNSACDIAVEAARFASSAHISMRRGYWFMPKTLFGIPFVELMKPWMPIPAQRAMIRALLRVAVGPYANYGLPHPDHRIFERHPTINSELLYYLRHGRITAHPDVARYDGHTAEFVDGSRADFDLIVCATGYHVSFPFVAPDVVRWGADGMPDLVGGLLPLRHKNIYFFGTGQPRYGAGPLITEGAKALVALIAAQKRMEEPIGAVLHGLGVPSIQSWLLDPHRVLRESKFVAKFAHRLPDVNRVRRLGAALRAARA